MPTKAQLLKENNELKEHINTMEKCEKLNLDLQMKMNEDIEGLKEENKKLKTLSPEDMKQNVFEDLNMERDNLKETIEYYQYEMKDYKEYKERDLEYHKKQKKIIKEIQMKNDLLDTNYAKLMNLFNEVRSENDGLKLKLESYDAIKNILEMYANTN